MIIGKGKFSKFLGYFRYIPIILVSKIKNKTFNSLLRLILPKSGEGPTENSRNSGYFKFRFYVFNKKIKAIASVSGNGCPGYGSTSKMLAETSICLALDKLPDESVVLRPSVGLGSKLLNRLEKNAGLKFEIKFL